MFKDSMLSAEAEVELLQDLRNGIGVLEMELDQFESSYVNEPALVRMHKLAQEMEARLDAIGIRFTRQAEDDENDVPVLTGGVQT